MTTYCILFGVKYLQETHPTGHKVDPYGWVEVEADNLNDAIEATFARYGRFYSRVAPADAVRKDTEFFPHGCTGRLLAIREGEHVHVYDRKEAEHTWFLLDAWLQGDGE